MWIKTDAGGWIADGEPGSVKKASLRIAEIEGYLIPFVTYEVDVDLVPDLVTETDALRYLSHKGKNKKRWYAVVHIERQPPVGAGETSVN